VLVTPVERLRAAAERVEALDGAASESPWEVIEKHGFDFSGEGYSHITLSMRDTDGDVAQWYGETEREPSDAVLIAALRPLAPWAATYLRHAAEDWDAQVQDDQGDRVWHIGGCEQTILKDGSRPQPPYYRCQCFDDALALADLILGGCTATATATRPEVPPVTVHPYIAARQGIGCAAPHQDGGPCHQTADQPVHRVEILPPDCRRALELWAGVAKYQPGEAVAPHVMTALLRLGLAADAGGVTGQMRATARGRAWLEAHPRQSGGAS
jgi:hypothetical protein